MTPEERTQWFKEFEEVIRRKRRFVYMTQGAWESVRTAGLPIRISFGNVYRLAQPWRSELSKIPNDPHRRMYHPNTTDDAVWDAVSSQFGFWHEKLRVPSLFMDGSVAEFMTTKFEIWTPADIAPRNRLAGRGEVVFLRYLHHPSHVKNLRHKVEEVLRANPTDVVRVSKLLKLR